MTREEEILNAARTIAERHQIAEMELYGGDKCNYSYGRIYFSEIASFEAGAKWADQHPNNVWHDASEEPLLEDKEIIFLNEQGISYISEKFGGTFTYMLEELSWERFVELLRISKWAYISDLLPKGGEK